MHLVITGLQFVEDLSEKESMATYMAILRLPRACYQSTTTIGCLVLTFVICVLQINSTSQSHII